MYFANSNYSSLNSIVSVKIFGPRRNFGLKLVLKNSLGIIYAFSNLED